MGWWVADQAGRPSLLVGWILWVLGSIVLHELAHGWMAIRFGDRTPIDSGHMTWNPVVHMGGMSLLMFALVGIAWGQMPVNPRRFRGRHAEAWVAAAGPLMNLALAGAAVLLCSLWIAFHPGRDTALYMNLREVLFLGATLNLVLMAFNLLPIPPLDGATVLGELWPKYRDLVRNPNFGPVLLIAFFVVFFKGGGYLFAWAASTADRAIGAVLSVLPLAS